MNTALLILRLALGAAMAADGAQKLFGWFGGYGLKATGAFFDSIGFQPGVPFALAAGLTEFVSGLLVAVGLAGPIGPALMLSVMLVAILTVHKANGFFATANGIELPGLYLIGSVSVALAGPGGYSLDYILGLDSFFSQTATLIALGAGVFVAFGNLAVRDAPKTAVKA